MDYQVLAFQKTWEAT